MKVKLPKRERKNEKKKYNRNHPIIKKVNAGDYHKETVFNLFLTHPPPPSRPLYCVLLVIAIALDTHACAQALYPPHQLYK